MQIKLSQILSSLESGGRPKGGASLDCNGIPSLGAEHLDSNGGFNFKSVKFVPEDYYNELKSGIIEKENILIVKDGATTGKVSFISDDFPFEKAAVNEHVFLVKIDKSKASPKFAFHYLRCPQGQRDIMKDFRGATVGGISRGFVDYVMFELPSLRDQLHIAHILSKAETLIAQRKESIRLLDEFLKNTFLEIFGNNTANDKGWEKIPLVGGCKNEKDVKCGPFGTQLSKSEYQDNGIPVWGIPQINSEFKILPKEYLTKDKAAELDEYSVIPYDIVMSRKGNVGKCSLFPKGFSKGIIHSDVLRIRTDNEKVHPVFLLYQLKCSKKIEMQIKGVTKGAIMAGINVGLLKHIIIDLPPLELQTQFAWIVEKAEALKAHYQQSLRELENLYGSLSQRAFRGELSYEIEKTETT